MILFSFSKVVHKGTDYSDDNEGNGKGEKNGPKEDVRLAILKKVFKIKKNIKFSYDSSEKI